jgi:glycosyltransferase involved in cell wall biosynthesis
MAALAAIQYGRDAFDTRERMMGRQVAGKTFLQAWIAHSGVDPLTFWTESDAQRHAATRQSRELGATMPIAHAAPHQLDPLRAAGALWLADPSLGRFAWDRRWRRQDGWSLVGITHTMSSQAAMDRVAELLVAPVQPWDALICTSRAIRSFVMAVLEAEADYLRARVGAQVFAGPMLPVIPLGVPCDALDPDPADRVRWRAELGLGDDDVAVLQFGRLVVHAKAHPVPLYLALRDAGARLGRPLHLILAGHCTNPAQDVLFRALAAEFAPHVTTHFVDGMRPDVDGVRAAADIGTLLSDNIQESFGLAPVELMAAGLPVVATDWDGLRDTVVDGETGMLIPTLLPVRGAGEVIARRYALGLDTNDRFIGAVAQSTALDLGRAADAFHALAADRALRQRMGAAAQARARTHYDWPVIIRRHCDLLAELAALRGAGQGEHAPRRPGGPLRGSRMDPFAAFAAHATAPLDPALRVDRAPAAPASAAAPPGGPEACLFNPAVLPPVAVLDAMVARAAGGCSVDELAVAFRAVDGAALINGVGWLLKYGYLVRV